MQGTEQRRAFPSRLWDEIVRIETIVFKGSKRERQRLSLPTKLLLWAFLCSSSRPWIATSKTAMSVNPRCFALSQISFLVTSITKKNYKYNSAEIASVRFHCFCVVVLINAQLAQRQNAPVVGVFTSVSLFCLADWETWSWSGKIPIPVFAISSRLLFQWWPKLIKGWTTIAVTGAGGQRSHHQTQLCSSVVLRVWKPGE